MRRLALVCALAACGGEVVPGTFTTQCGVTYRGAAAGFETTSASDAYAANILQAQEDLAIAYGLVTCEQLQGISFYTRPEPWISWGALIDGQTVCDPFHPRIEVSLSSSYTLLHEFHHVAQWCNPPGPTDTGTDPMHANWYRSGAFERIERASMWFLITHWGREHNYASPYSVGGEAQFAPTDEDKARAE